MDSVQHDVQALLSEVNEAHKGVVALADRVNEWIDAAGAWVGVLGSERPPDTARAPEEERDAHRTRFGRAAAGLKVIFSFPLCRHC